MSVCSSSTNSLTFSVSMSCLKKSKNSAELACLSCRNALLSSQTFYSKTAYFKDLTRDEPLDLVKIDVDVLFIIGFDKFEQGSF